MAKSPKGSPTGLRFNHWQYKYLKGCAARREEGMQRWNQWREKHLEREVFLEGADLSWKFLEEINLNGASKEDPKDCHKLIRRGNVYLESAEFWRTDLRKADLQDAHLEGARIYRADLRGTMATGVVVDGRTIISGGCLVDRSTIFTGVALDTIRIRPEIKQVLQYNIRRDNWEYWYDDENEPIHEAKGVFRCRPVRMLVNRVLKWLVQRFWEISDYGISTKRVIWTFFKWAMLFALVYYVIGAVDYYIMHKADNPGVVANLFVNDGLSLSAWLVPLRSTYFSVVTMTTLGFGDMYAHSESILGHILLTLQVLLGYMLLGALVTRFAVLFTAGGPAGQFSASGDDEPD